MGCDHFGIRDVMEVNLRFEYFKPGFTDKTVLTLFSVVFVTEFHAESNDVAFKESCRS